VVENTFGILSQKFRTYNRRIQAMPKNVDSTILATCVLHNFIKKYDTNTYNYERNETYINGPNDKGLENLPMQGGNATKDAFHVREKFKDYFNLEVGSLSWQEGII